MRIKKQQTVCEWQQADPLPPAPGSKLGIAMATLGKQPVNGLRHPPEAGTCGWYIWCGEVLSEEDDFFQPLHVEHLVDHLPEFVEYLDLPPGYRVLIDGNNWEDVWRDDSLLDAQKGE